MSSNNNLDSRMNNQDQPISEFKSKSGLKRIFSALRYSLEGFKSAWRGEHSFRQEVFLVIVATAIAWFLVGETRPGRSTTSASEQAPPMPFVRQMQTLLAHRGFLLVSLIALMNAVVRTGGLFALIPLLAVSTLGLTVNGLASSLKAVINLTWS